MPKTTTVFQLKTRWSEKYFVDVRDLRLSTEDRNELHDGESINDIADDNAKVLHVSLEEAVKVQFSVMDSDTAAVQLAIFLSSSPSNEIAKIKEQFAIEESRPARLLLNSSPLDASLPFEGQNVTQNSMIEVELGWRVRVKSEWTRDEDLETVSCFSGDQH